MHGCCFVLAAIGATAAVDYVPIFGVALTFVPAAVQTQRQCVDVAIIQDAIFEDEEAFGLSLNSSDSDVSLNPTTAETRVEISDDDGEIINHTAINSIHCNIIIMVTS